MEPLSFLSERPGVRSRPADLQESARCGCKDVIMEDESIWVAQTLQTLKRLNREPYHLRLHLLHLALGGGHVGLRLHQLHLQLLLLGDSVAQLPLHVSLLGRQLVRLLLRALRRRLGRRRLLALLRGGCGVGLVRSPWGKYVNNFLYT